MRKWRVSSYVSILASSTSFFFFLKILFIYFLERGERREKEREINIIVWEITSIGCLLHAHNWGTWPATQACALTGTWTCDLLVHRSAFNPLSHTSQGRNYSFFMWNSNLDALYFIWQPYHKWEFLLLQLPHPPIALGSESREREDRGGDTGGDGWLSLPGPWQFPGLLTPF